MVNMGDVHEGNGERIWDRLHTPRGQKRTKPSGFYCLIFALSWPCLPHSHHRCSSHHPSLSVGAESLPGSRILHSCIRQKSPATASLYRMLFKFSEKPGASIFLIGFEGYKKSLLLLIHKSFNHMPFWGHMLSFLPLTLGKICRYLNVKSAMVILLL